MSVTPSARHRPLRILFLGGVGVVPGRVLNALLDAGHVVAGVLIATAEHTALRRDRRLSRLAPRWSLAAGLRRIGLPVTFVETLAPGSAAADAIAAFDGDVILSVHFMKILPAALLAQLSRPVLNLHPALLPAYRGPSPVIGMLLDGTGHRSGGLTLHRLTAAIDAGPVHAAVAVPPPPGGWRRWSFDLARAAATLVVDTLPGIVAGRIAAVPQDEAAATYRRLAPGELELRPTDTAGRAGRLLGALADSRRVPLILGEARYPVTAILARLGPPAGAPPRIGPFSIDCDLADARLRLRRRPVWAGQAQRWRACIMGITER